MAPLGCRLLHLSADADGSRGTHLHAGGDVRGGGPSLSPPPHRWSQAKSAFSKVLVWRHPAPVQSGKNRKENRAIRMSAIGGKADVRELPSECLLRATSGNLNIPVQATGQFL